MQTNVNKVELALLNIKDHTKLELEKAKESMQKQLTEKVNGM